MLLIRESVQGSRIIPTLKSLCLDQQLNFVLVGQGESKQTSDNSQSQENAANISNNEQRTESPTSDDQYYQLLKEETDAINKKDGTLC